MTNANKLSNNKENEHFLILTANEVANTIGENYRTVQKMLNILASTGEIEVTEKTVNNRTLKGYKVTNDDIQKVKSKFKPKGHLQSTENSTKIQMLQKAIDKVDEWKNSDENTNDINVKFYEVITKNSELEKENEILKKDLQDKINSNTRLDADLSIARSQIKFIEDKQKTFENSYMEQKLENEKLNKIIKNRNVTLIVLGSILLVLLTVVLTVVFLR